MPRHGYKTTNGSGPAGSGGFKARIWRVYSLLRKISLSACLLAAPAGGAWAAAITVELVNGLSDHAIANTRIIAKRVTSDGGLKWVASKTSDTLGKALFDLDGLGAGTSYVFETEPYNGGRVRSKIIESGGHFRFTVGWLPVTVLDGANFQPMPDTSVAVKKLTTDGKFKWLKSGTTDAAGQVIFDMHELGDGGIYRLEAKSPWDGSRKLSAEISQRGAFRFVVGNKPLFVSLVDGLTGERLPGADISAYEILADGKKKWVSRHTTDTSGAAVFDLDELGTGRQYRLSARPFNGGTSYTPVLNAPGDVLFEVGTLTVSLISGADGSELGDTKVVALEVFDDGTKKWTKDGITDAQGAIRFDLDGLGQGRHYMLRAASPVDGSKKYSDVFTARGRYTFDVGNKPMTVTLVNGVSGAPLADMSISAKEILADGKKKWTTSHHTDSSGVAVFDLDGLGSGREYVFYVKPYNGGSVYSPVFTQTGDYTFRVGTVPVTLSNKDSGKPFADTELVVYARTADDKLRWVRSGKTDVNGTVHFDMPGFAQSEIYTIRARNLFGLEKKYHSPWIRTEGPVNFSVNAGGDYSLDMDPPWINIEQPGSGGKLADVGFSVSGRATDDKGIERISLSIVNAGKATTVLPVTYSAASGMWSVEVGAAMITAGDALTIQAQALDLAHNKSVSVVNVNIVADKQPPELQITSHAGGDGVLESGFALVGTAVDDTRMRGVSGSVTDSSLGRTLSEVPARLDASGAWYFQIPEGALAAGGTLDVEVHAEDMAGNVSNTALSLQVIDNTIHERQLLNRVSFGTTPELLDEVRAIGAGAWLEQQLDPLSVDDSALQEVLGVWLPENRKDMPQWALTHMIHSRRQLREVMTWFWDNHFNTDINKHYHVEYELGENMAFRENALGRFRNLLEISARSPAMLIYLDSARSRKESPNENYARELLELHTMGVDGGYGHHDLEEIARVFTGWRVMENQFFFDARRHDFGEKHVLGRVLPAGRGIEDGVEVLDMLAEHPSTAKHICTKLLQLFVADTPAEAWVNDCSGSFLASDGDIGFVVSGILRSAAFNSPDNVFTKVKTPLEYITGLVRNFGVKARPYDLRRSLSTLGMPLFENSIPTGWSEEGVDWVNSNQVMQRVQIGTGLAFNKIDERYTHVDIVALLRARNLTNPEQIVGFFFDLAMSGRYTDLEWAIAMDTLIGDGTVTFSLDTEHGQHASRALFATLLSYPGYQMQ